MNFPSQNVKGTKMEKLFGSVDHYDLSNPQTSSFNAMFTCNFLNIRCFRNPPHPASTLPLLLLFSI